MFNYPIDLFPILLFLIMRFFIKPPIFALYTVSSIRLVDMLTTNGLS